MFSIINSVSVLIIIIISSVYITNYIIKLKDSEEGIYYGVVMTKEQKDDIELTKNYILEQKRNGTNVIILSYRSMAYTTELGINNGVFELAFLGNMGRSGERGLINQISQLKNSKILITKDEKDKVYQESELARNYVIENFIYDGEIGEFLIYKTTN